MSGKTRHFAKADERSSQQEIKEGFAFLEGSENPINQETILIEEELEDVPPQSEPELDSAEQCFCDAGGSVCEEIPSNWRRSESDDEDRRFGDTSVNCRKTALINNFGNGFSEIRRC